MDEKTEFTQKELMQHLLQAAQHSATREELNQVRNELKGDIAELKTELKSDMAELKSDLKSDMAELKSELKGDTAGLKSELKNDIASIKKDIEPLKTMEYRLTIKLGGLMITGITILAALIKLT